MPHTSILFYSIGEMNFQSWSKDLLLERGHQSLVRRIEDSYFAHFRNAPSFQIVNLRGESDVLNSSCPFGVKYILIYFKTLLVSTSVKCT